LTIEHKRGKNGNSGESKRLQKKKQKSFSEKRGGGEKGPFIILDSRVKRRGQMEPVSPIREELADSHKGQGTDMFQRIVNQSRQ